MLFWTNILTKYWLHESVMSVTGDQMIFLQFQSLKQKHSIYKTILINSVVFYYCATWTVGVVGFALVESFSWGHRTAAIAATKTTLFCFTTGLSKMYCNVYLYVYIFWDKWKTNKSQENSNKFPVSDLPLSNAGGDSIIQTTLDFWKAGRNREEIELRDLETLLSLSVFNNNQSE